MIQTQKFQDVRTGEIVTQFPIHLIKFFKEVDEGYKSTVIKGVEVMKSKHINL